MSKLQVAALISGEPRFSEEFDHFIKHLTGYAKITWFFFLWKTPNSTSIHSNQFVAPYWQNVDYDRSYKMIRDNLPNNHDIGSIKIEDPQNYALNFDVRNRAPCCHRPENVWSMWQSWYHGYKLIEDSKKKFDLVLRVRGDISLSEPLNLSKIKTMIDKKPNRVIVPNNNWHGYSRSICDNMAISRMKTMNIYCSLKNSIAQFQEEGVIYHPETCLAEHLFRNNLEVVRHTFDIGLRHLGLPENPYGIKYGRWNQ